MIALPEAQNLFKLRKEFSESMATAFSELGILDLYKSRGAFAAYWSSLETDLKSVAASGWKAELIPDEVILKSQFPEVLQELADNEARRDELEALFAEVNAQEEDDPDSDRDEEEEDNDETLIFSKERLKEFKEQLKQHNAAIRDAKKEIRALKKRIKANEETAALEADLKTQERLQEEHEQQKAALDAKLKSHNAHTQELKDCKAAIKEIKDKKEALVNKARAKITPQEAKELILGRWQGILYDTVMDYVQRYERELLAALETRFSKYETQLTAILNERNQASEKLDHFLMELGYEG